MQAKEELLNFITVVVLKLIKNTEHSVAKPFSELTAPTSADRESRVERRRCRVLSDFVLSFLNIGAYAPDQRAHRVPVFQIQKIEFHSDRIVTTLTDRHHSLITHDF